MGKGAISLAHVLVFEHTSFLEYRQSNDRQSSFWVPGILRLGWPLVTNVTRYTQCPHSPRIHQAFLVVPSMRRQLTPATTYYIRKLLNRNLNRLTFAIVDSTGKKADVTTDLGDILDSLYVKAPKIAAMTGELERLALLHQSLSQASVRDSQDIQNTEAQIFGLLGCEIRVLSAPQSSIAKMTQPSSPHSIGTILVGDAEPRTRQLFTSALTYYGYRVFTATAGMEVLDRIHRIQPDAVVLNVMLPDMSGYAVCEQIKATSRTQNIPVVFLSAVSSDSSRMQAFQSGGVEYITKPFEGKEIFLRVTHHIDRCKRERLEDSLKQSS
jgi:CheY-like chemotaxis protein